MNYNAHLHDICTYVSRRGRKASRFSQSRFHFKNEPSFPRNSIDIIYCVEDECSERVIVNAEGSEGGNISIDRKKFGSL